MTTKFSTIKFQGCPGTEREPETGTVGTVFSGSQKRGVEFKGGSRHDRNRHNRRNRQNRQNRLLVLYFVGEARGGQGAL